ncbi:DUF1428 domain-containing protein [bacterium]|nr:DUF1428 domain-containing protein [bacterium]
MDYIDGFVVPVPTAQKEEYRQLAQTAAAIFKEYGALGVVEAWGEDVPPGQRTSFPLAVQLEPQENVVFSWVRWPSKSVRDEGMKKFMEDERMKCMPMPFDGNRMIYGGFQILVEL